MEMHEHMAYVLIVMNCWHRACETIASKITPKRIGVQALVPRGCKHWCRDLQAGHETSGRSGTAPQSSKAQRGDPEVEAARYPAPGETGCFFRGRAFRGNIYLSPFPSRFKRREYNLRMVQLQTSASAVVLVHELVQVLVCKQSEQSTLAARDLAR